MNEGLKRNVTSPETSRDFFPEHGKLTRQEVILLRFLGSYIDKERITLESFVGLFSKENISIDEASVEKRKKEFETENKKIAVSNPENAASIERGKLSEQAIIYSMQVGQWFGAGSRVRVASEFDDYFRGIDCIAELDSSRQLAIGIDTTISKNKISQKLSKIRNQILNNKLAEVKYFKNDNITGSLHNIPLTIIGVDLEANSSLAELVYGTETTDQKEIKKHKVQFIILFEIRMQLEIFLEFAIKIDAKSEIIAKLREDLMKIKEVIREKAPKDKVEKEKLIFEIKRDEVFKTIKQALDTEFTKWKEPDIVVAKLK